MKYFLLKLVAGNLDSLIAFLSDLDTQLDTLIAKEQAKDVEISKQIDELSIERNKAQDRAATAANLKAGVRSITNGA